MARHGARGGRPGPRGAGHSVDARRDSRGGAGRGERPGPRPVHRPRGRPDGGRGRGPPLARRQPRRTRRSRCTPHPDHRRRGHGSAMLAHVRAGRREHTAGPCSTPRARGRTTRRRRRAVAARPRSSSRGTDTGSGSATSTGCSPLPVADGLLESAGRRGGADTTRRTRSARGSDAVPDDVVESLAALVAQLMVEAPTGDLRAGAGERRRRRVPPRRGDHSQAGAHGVQQRRPGRRRRPWWRTPTWRPRSTTRATRSSGARWCAAPTAGTGSVLAVKVADLRLLQARARCVPARLHTWNAEVNRHMIAINERAGLPAGRAHGRVPEDPRLRYLPGRTSEVRQAPGMRRFSRCARGGA